MINPRVCTFDDFEAAQAARQELLSAGFDGEALQLSSRQDEAGPVEGNFVIGNAKHHPLHPPGSANGSRERENTDYVGHFDKTVHRGVYLLAVVSRDEQQQQQALAVMERHGGLDLESRMPPPADVSGLRSRP